MKKPIHPNPSDLPGSQTRKLSDLNLTEGNGLSFKLEQKNQAAAHFAGSLKSTVSRLDSSAGV